jgi:surfeit locus 1 family protein
VTAGRISARTLVAIGGLLLISALCASAAVWQWQRAEQSRAVTASFAAGGDETPLPGPPAALTEAERFHRLEVRGTYAAEPQFLLDNMLHNGAAGYHVLTPFKIADSARSLLVNRGWVAAGDRSTLPEVGVAADARSVSGRLERLPRPGMRLGTALPERTVGATVVQYPTAAELAERLGEPLYDYQLLLDSAAPDGFVRDWQPPVLPPERHLSYAGQWLVFATGALIAAVTIAIKNARLRP